MPQLRQLIACLREADPEQSWKPALEFRNNTWYGDSLLEFAEAEKVAVAIQDIPASATPLDYATGDFVYLRFHGPGGKYAEPIPKLSYRNTVTISANGRKREKRFLFILITPWVMPFVT